MNFRLSVTASAVLAFTVVHSASAAQYQVTVTNLTSGLYFTPLIAAAHPSNVAMFASGQPASAPMQAIAEGGDTSAMAATLESVGAAVTTGGGLLAPGASEVLVIESDDPNNAVLSVTGMLLPTNDGFVGLNSVPLPQTSAVYTHNVPGYDAGTEANDELVGSGAPGEAGFPAPPPVVASGTGVGGTGVPGTSEGFVHIHRNVIGDLDSNGGISDINAAVHRWLNPVARISIQRIGDDISGVSGSTVVGLSGIDYSSSSLEIFWQPPETGASMYEVRRDGTLIATTDGLSLFEEGLAAGTSYQYDVVPLSADGTVGANASVTVSTRAN